jgi:hypothetical protein
MFARRQQRGVRPATDTRPTLETAAAALLTVVPIAFNLALISLARALDDPPILRRPPDEILRQYHAGGAGRSAAR